MEVSGAGHRWMPANCTRYDYEWQGWSWGWGLLARQAACLTDQRLPVVAGGSTGAGQARANP